jgi:hypothetical protein
MTRILPPPAIIYGEPLPYPCPIAGLQLALHKCTLWQPRPLPGRRRLVELHIHKSAVLPLWGTPIDDLPRYAPPLPKGGSPGLWRGEFPYQ